MEGGKERIVQEEGEIWALVFTASFSFAFRYGRQCRAGCASHTLLLHVYWLIRRLDWKPEASLPSPCSSKARTPSFITPAIAREILVGSDSNVQSTQVLLGEEHNGQTHQQRRTDRQQSRTSPRLAVRAADNHGRRSSWAFSNGSAWDSVCGRAGVEARAGGK